MGQTLLYKTLVDFLPSTRVSPWLGRPNCVVIHTFCFPLSLALRPIACCPWFRRWSIALYVPHSSSSFVSSNTSIFPNGIVAKARSFSGCCSGSKSSSPICFDSRNWMNQTSTAQQCLIKHGGLHSTTGAHGMRAYNSNKTADHRVRHSRTPRSKSASECSSLFAPNSCVYCTTRYNKCGRIGTKWLVVVVVFF